MTAPDHGALRIRDIAPDDHAAVLALNLESEALLSPMDGARLLGLLRETAYHRVLVDEGDRVLAFLLAFREGCGYDSPNYRWFQDHYLRFLYIDWIAVSSTQQGRGLGAVLYRDLFEFARASGTGAVACEFYSQPLNEGSSRFHAKFGFGEVGTQWVAEGRKQVSLQIATL